VRSTVLMHGMILELMIFELLNGHLTWELHSPCPIRRWGWLGLRLSGVLLPFRRAIKL